MKKITLLALCISSFVYSKSGFDFFSTSSPKCKEKIKQLPLIRQLVLSREFSHFTQDKNHEHLINFLSTWPTDQIITSYLEIEQQYLNTCEHTKEWTSILSSLKTAYLLKVNIKASSFPARDVDFLFRGFLSLPSDIPVLAQKLKNVPPKDALSILTEIYGATRVIKGVVATAAKLESLIKLELLVNEICGENKVCPFWDRRVLIKTIVVSQPGLATYIPELGALIISTDLIETPTELTKIVFLHELSHIATRFAKYFYDKDWVEEFVQFSGWQKLATDKWTVQVQRHGIQRPDVLSQLSIGSPYSILPDDIYIPKVLIGQSTFDGFVLAKSYQESVNQNDPAEDLADHIAVYFYIPERFCFQGKPLAENKFNWIAQNVFGVFRHTSCMDHSTEREIASVGK